MAPSSTLPLAQQVYQDAIALYKKQHASTEDKRQWLSDKSTLADVQAAISAAKEKYDARTQGKVRKSISRISAGVMYYSKILDALVQQTPEHASLAWGTMKLLFVLVMNHEELTSELCKALSKISDVLPRTEIHLDLHPTTEMKEKVEDLFVQIIDFYGRALQWYEASRPKHAIMAFIKPYKLQFEDVVQSIDERARSIDQLATSLAYREIRDIYTLVKSCLQEQRQTRSEQHQRQDSDQSLATSDAHAHMRHTELRALLISHQAVNSAALLNVQQMLRETQVAQMIDAARSTSILAPHESLRQLSHVYSRRSLARTFDPSHFWKHRELRSWNQAPTSSVLLVSGSFTVRNVWQMLGLYTTELVRSSSTPIFWALKGPKRLSTPASPSELFKYFAMQALQQQAAGASGQISANFNAARVAGACTTSEWLEVLKNAIVGLPCIYVILDAELLSDRDDFADLLDALKCLIVQSGNTVLKVMVFGCRKRGWSRQDSDWLEQGGLHQIDLDKILGAHAQKVLHAKSIKVALRCLPAQDFKRNLRENINDNVAELQPANPESFEDD